MRPEGVSRETPAAHLPPPAMTDNCALLPTVADTPSNAECESKLKIFVELLRRWRTATNLVSDPSFADVWTRHVADSAQLLAYAPSARRWVDLGSGAGFPGMVIAIQLAEYPGAVVHCIESNKRKAAFLREVARATAAPALVHVDRIELIDANSLLPVDAVTARGLAPLPRLVEFASVWLANGAIGIFPCGRSTKEQVRGLTQAVKLELESFPSKLDPSAQIVRVRRAMQANNDSVLRHP
jgi:16S rRNA (guanine527-N7)-methyltransferase